jgi:hypothetical protein
LRVETGELLSQAGIPEGLLGELAKLGALLGAHRVEHPLRGGRPGGERVDQFVDVAWVLREEIPVPAHELLEPLPDVAVTAGVRGEQVVQVRQHLAYPLDVLRWGGLQRLLHALEPLLQ